MGLQGFLKGVFYTGVGLWVCLGGIVSGAGAAGTPIGKIVALRGRAMAFQEGETPRPLALKSPVFLKDTIETARGRLQIMFTDNTLMTLGRNAKMVLEAYMWKQGNPDSKLETRVKAGSFRVMGGAITRDAPRNFKTHAPSATIGIRGSMYAGVVRGNHLSVVYQGGRGIYVSNSRGRVEIDRPGFGTRVMDKGEPPLPPEHFDQPRLEEIEGPLADAGATVQGGEGGEIVRAQADEDGLNMVAGSLEEEAFSEPPDTVPATPDTVTEGLADLGTQTIIENLVPVGENSYEQAVFDLLWELGFAGERSTTVPTSGIWAYSGILRDEDSAYTDDTLTAYVNWNSGRFMAFEKDPHYSGATPGGFAIGRITSTGAIESVRLFGSGGLDSHGDIYAFTGRETFGQVYGSSQGALGMTLEGTDYPLNQASSLPNQPWSDTMAATFDKVFSSSDAGNSWNGFFMGLAENMNNIDLDRVCFINDDAADFSISFNRNAGTFSGIMNGYDAFGSSALVDDLEIGGTGLTQSAYIADDLLGAELGGTDVIVDGAGTDLKPHGNFMVSSMETQLSDNTYWGYWEIAYNEPGSGDAFHLHVPGALWIAGVRTPAATVQWLMDNQPAGTLAYNGRAMGILVDTTLSPGMQQVSQLTNGTTSLDVDFNGKTITGNINFSGTNAANLAVTVAAANFLNTGFEGTIGGATSSEVHGAFFGPNAEGLGGNFSADFSGKHYQGIFAADR